MARDRPPPKELTDAIDRIMPMLRFFRLGDGTLARFNGAGPTPTDALATVLAYDDIEGTPVRTAANSGYVRVEAGDHADRLRPRAAAGASLSTNAHAGFLSFEMSSGDCPHDHQLRRALARPRRLAAVRPHHAGAFDAQPRGRSRSPSSRAGPTARSRRADATLSGPLNPQGAFSDQGDNLRIKGSHDGYMGRYGVSHSRQILIAPSGNLLSARTSCRRAGSRARDGADRRLLRHPLPSASEREGAERPATAQRVTLILRNGETWRISSNAEETGIEESVLLADPRGPQPTSQVVLSGMMGEAREVRIVWNIEKTGDGSRGRIRWSIPTTPAPTKRA